jgi:hypothetical protein
LAIFLILISEVYMKRQTILAIAALLVFGLGNATFAYTQTTGTAVSCTCCKGDSCPMKKKDASGKETASCCDDCDCCKGDSKATAKTVSYYFKGVAHYKSSKSKCKCCDAKKDVKPS